MGLESYSSVATNNTKPPPNGAPEGMNPGSVNDCIRQVMADTRAWYEGAEWINLGTISGSATIGAPTYVSATSFTVAGNVATIFHVNRRVKAAGTTPFTIYGTITAVAYSAPNTTVTVQWDSGSLDATLTTVWYGVISAQNSSLTAKAFGAATLNGFGAQTSLASTATTDLGTTGTNNVNITGTTAITSFGSLASSSSPVYQVYFSGALTLTQNATSLILPGGANITTAAGDSLTALYLGSGNWRVLEYNLGTGKALVTDAYATNSQAIAGTSTNNPMTPAAQAAREQSRVFETPVPAGVASFTALFPVGFDEYELEVDNLPTTAGGNWSLNFNNTATTSTNGTPLTSNCTGQYGLFQNNATAAGLSTTTLNGSPPTNTNFIRQLVCRITNAANSTRTVCSMTFGVHNAGGLCSGGFSGSDTNNSTKATGLTFTISTGTFYASGASNTAIVRVRGIPRYS